MSAPQRSLVALLAAGLVAVCGTTEPSADHALPSDVKMDRMFVGWDASALADLPPSDPAAPTARADQKSDRTLGLAAAYYAYQNLPDFLSRRQDSGTLGGGLMLSRNDERGFTMVSGPGADRPQERSGGRRSGLSGPGRRPHGRRPGPGPRRRPASNGRYPGPVPGSHYGGRPQGGPGGGLGFGGPGPAVGAGGHGGYPAALNGPSHYGGGGGAGGRPGGHGHGGGGKYAAALSGPSHYGG